MLSSLYPFRTAKTPAAVIQEKIAVGAESSQSLAEIEGNMMAVTAGVERALAQPQEPTK